MQRYPFRHKQAVAIIFDFQAAVPSQRCRAPDCPEVVILPREVLRRQQAVSLARPGKSPSTRGWGSARVAPSRR
eukprot:15437896-Alexandrium_andersonii.AAC.1